MDKLLKNHLDLLADPKEKAKYAGIWNKHRKNKDEGVQNFLKEAQWNERLQNLYSEKRISSIPSRPSSWASLSEQIRSSRKR